MQIRKKIKLWCGQGNDACGALHHSPGRVLTSIKLEPFLKVLKDFHYRDCLAKPGTHCLPVLTREPCRKVLHVFPYLPAVTIKWS